MFGFKKKDKNAVELGPRPSPEDLIKQYNDGRVLIADKETNNKEYFKSLKNKKGERSPKLGVPESLKPVEEAPVEGKTKKTFMSKILSIFFSLFKFKLTKNKDGKNK